MSAIDSLKKPDTPPRLTFTFDLAGDGKKVFCGAFKTETLEKAVREARKRCKSLTLPGWRLHCRETGNDYAAVEFKSEDGTKSYA